MSLSGITHHSHSFTRLEIYHHIYFNKYLVLSTELMRSFGFTSLRSDEGLMLETSALELALLRFALTKG